MAAFRFELPPGGLEAARVCLSAAEPAAGSGEQLRAVGRRSAALAGELRSVEGRLRSVSQNLAWRGEAGDGFAERVGRGAPVFAAVAARYDGYAGALLGYAAAVESAGAELPGLRRGLESRMDSIGPLAVPVFGPAGPGAAGPSGPALAGPALAGSGPVLVGVRSGPAVAGLAEVDPHADLVPWARRFKSVYDGWADAADRCAERLGRVAAADPGGDLHGWRAFGHAVGKVQRYAEPAVYFAEHPSARSLSEAAGTLSAELSVVALGLLLVFPPAAGVALAAATALSAAQLAVDAGRKADGAPVGWGTLLVEAAAVVPVVGKLGALGEAAAVVPAVGKAAKVAKAARLGEVAIDALPPAADRVASALAPGGGLAAHEAAGGHTLAKHVGRTIAQLRARILKEPWIPGASTFADRTMAEHSVSQITQKRQAEIDAWLSSTKGNDLTLYGRAHDVAGQYLSGPDAAARDVHGVVVLLRRDASMPGGYRVQTAFVAP